MSVNLMKRIYKKADASKVTVIYNGDNFIAAVFPTFEQARKKVTAQLEKEGVTTIEMKDYLARCHKIEETRISYGTGRTADAALEELLEKLT